MQSGARYRHEPDDAREPAAANQKLTMRPPRTLLVPCAAVVMLALVPAREARAQGDSAVAGSERSAPTAESQSGGATALRLHVTDSPGQAFRRVMDVLAEAGYELQHAESEAGILTTRFRYVRGAGLVQLSAVIVPDSGGAVLQLSGASRRLRRVVVVSALAPVETLVHGGGDPRQERAWRELAEIAAALTPRRITYVTTP